MCIIATVTDRSWYGACSRGFGMHRTISMGMAALLLAAPLSMGCSKPHNTRTEQATMRAEEAARRAEAAAGRTEAAAQRADTAAERAERIFARQSER